MVSNRFLVFLVVCFLVVSYVHCKRGGGGGGGKKNKGSRSRGNKTPHGDDEHQPTPHTDDESTLQEQIDALKQQLEQLQEDGTGCGCGHGHGHGAGGQGAGGHGAGGHGASHGADDDEHCEQKVHIVFSGAGQDGDHHSDADSINVNVNLRDGEDEHHYDAAHCELGFAGTTPVNGSFHVTESDGHVDVAAHINYLGEGNYEGHVHISGSFHECDAAGDHYVHNGEDFTVQFTVGPSETFNSQHLAEWYHLHAKDLFGRSFVVHDAETGEALTCCVFGIHDHDDGDHSHSSSDDDDSDGHSHGQGHGHGHSHHEEEEEEPVAESM